MVDESFAAAARSHKMEEVA